MNRIYKTLWSVSTQSWQAVPETAKASGKKSSSSAVGVVASVALSLSLSGGANAQSPPAINQLPTGGTVARGTATISQTATAQAAAMTVNQSSQRAVINWNTFNLGQSASINFVQPNAQAVTLNRVNDSNPSQIFGRMTANGQVFLSNANGVYFSPTSSVDVGALTATTHSISDDNFMSGKYVFERNGAAGKVTNDGNIATALGGYVALLAPEVQNAGVVLARAGTVAFAAGEMITLTIDGAGSLAGITTTPSTIATLVENKHAVLAPDGQIILSAVALDKLQAGVIKNSGSLEANSISHKGGKIYLEGDDITLNSNSKLEAKGATGGGTVLVGGDWQGSGDMRQATKVTMEAGATINASATDKGDGGKVVLWSDVHNADSVTRVNGSIKAEAGPNGGDGGMVETSGHDLKVGDAIQVSTQSTKGNTGEWLLDPKDFTIAASGGDMTGTALGNLLASNNISISSGTGANTATSYFGSVGGTAGNININDSISWSTNKTLTLTATGGVTGSGGIEMTGLGTVIFNHTTSGISTTYSGTVSGNGNVTKQGAGGMTFSTAQTYTGNTTVTLGGIEFDGAIASSNISLNTGSVVFYTTNSGSRTVASNISGSGSISLAGFLSTYTFTGNNTYSGTTSFENTSLVLGSSNALGTGRINLTGKTGLIYTAQNTVDYSVRIDINTNSPLTVDTGGQNVIWAGTPFNSALVGSALIKNGVGTLTLNNGARLDGNTSSTPSTPPITVKAGTLVLGGNNNFGTNWSSGAGIVIDAGANLQVGNGISTGNLGGSIPVSNNGTLTFNRSDTGGLIVTNNISGTGNVIMAGTGDVALQSSGNTYSGGTRLVAGSLILGVDMSSATSPSLGTTGAISFEGGTLKYDNTSNDMTDYSSRFSRIDGKGYRFDIGSSDGPVWATALTDSGISTTSATLTKLGSGPLYLTGNNAYTGTTTVSAGKLYLGNDTTTGSVAGNIVLASSSTYLYVKRNGSFELSNNITGSDATHAGNLVVNMTNPNDVVTLSGSNVFNYVQLSSGALGLGSSHAIDRATASRDIYFSGGRLQYSSFDTSDYSDRFAIHSSTPSAPFAIDTNGQTVTFAPNSLAPLSNTLTTNSLEKYGTGTLILNFISGKGYSGATTVRAGTLQVGNGATGGTWRTSGAFVAADASLIFKPGSSDSSSIISTSVSQDPTTSTSGSVSFVQTGSTDIMTYSGNISNAISLFQLGSSTGTGGTLLLTGTNSSPSTGATTISLGTLKLGSADATGVLNTGVITNNGTLIYNRNDAKTISAKISGTGALIDQGSGTLTLSGANDYTGATTVSAGTLVITNATGLGTAAAGTTVASVATLDLRGVAVGNEAITLNGGTLATSTGTSSLTGTVTMGANSTVNVSGTALSLNGVVSGAYALTKSGSGALTLAAANTYTGATTVNAGTLVVTNPTGLGTTGVGAGTTVANATLDLQGVAVGNEAITLNGGSTLATSSGTSSLGGTVTMGAASTVNVGGTSLTLSGVVSGAYALTKSGSGTLVLAATNNTYGSTVFSAGTLRLANNGALPDSSLTVAAGNTLELGSINSSNLNVSGKTITLASSGTYGGGGYLHNVAGDNIWSGAITLQNNSTVAVDTNTSLNLSSAISTVDSAATVFLKPSNGSLTFGTLTGSGGASYVSSGSATPSGNFVGLGVKTLVYARPIDANNLNSSYYGSSPGLTLGFFSASTGGTQYNLVSGDYTGAIVYSGAPTATSAPGSYSISYSSGVTISNAAYYLAGTGASLAWTVNAKPLTITVGSSSKTYDGQAFSGGSVTYSAFANGQSASALTGSLTYGGTAQGAVNASSTPYTITASGLTSTNYAITYVDGSLTINKANLSKVTAAKTYDGLSTVTAAQMTAIEGVNGETFTASAGTANISDKNVTTANKTLTDLSNLTLVGSSNTVLASNYNLGTGLPAAGSANQVDISALALQVTGISALSKTFDGSNAVNLSGTAQVASLAGDAVTLDASGMTAQFGSTAVGRAIPVTVTGYALAGGSAGNYSLIQPTGLSADINSAAAPIQPPVVPPIVLPPAPVTPPSVPPGTSPISKDVIPPAPEAPAVPPVAEAPPASPVAEAGTNEPQTTNERTNNKNANSAVLAAAASVAQAVTARPQTVGIPTGAPAGTQASIQVLLVKPASVQTEGLVNVRVSADLVSSANNLVIPLADHLDWRQLQANDAVSVKLANGMSLPDWVQYEAPQKALVAKAIPLNALPLQVMVQIGDRRYLVDIREADLNKVGMQ